MTRHARSLAWFCAALVLAAAGTAEAAEPSAWSLRLSAEFGIGSREFDLPMDGVVNRTTTGLFPAAGLGFELDHAASDAVSLGLFVRYQSSISAGIVEQHTDGSEHPIDVRAHRLEIAFVPSIRFDAEARWVLYLAPGFAIRGFRPLEHLLTPTSSLAGPQLRVQLQVPLVSDVLRLRVGPEIQWIVDAGDDLADRGIASQGLGLGGEAVLEAVVSRHFTIGASYWEMRSWLESPQLQSFEDVARFITARLSGTL